MRALLWIVVAGTVCIAPASEFSARLNTPVSSYASSVGSEFRATVIQPAVDGHRILIPEGAVLHGRVISVRSVGMGIVRERAELELRVEAWESPGNSPLPCNAPVTGVDNARESVTRDGKIRGVLAAGGPSGLARGFWRIPSQTILHRPATRLIGFGTGGLAPTVTLGLMALRWAALRFPEPEIELPAGTEIMLTLRSQAPGAPEVEADPVPLVCSRIYPALPRELTKPGGKVADDIVNVLFAGTKQQLTAAFAAAGWVTADPLNSTTFLRMYKAWTSMKGYPKAPVSRMLYQGREPDLVFQKSFNTVARRHHVRIWSVPGRELWAGAATHDVGITFEFKANMLTHRIDPAIDRERAKIYTDLRAAGCISEAGLLPVRLPEVEGRSIETDGRVLRLGLQPCQARVPATGPAADKPGTTLSRMGRRLTLETKHYVVRDNWIYWGYRGIRAAGNTLLVKRPRKLDGTLEAARQDSLAAPRVLLSKGM